MPEACSAKLYQKEKTMKILHLLSQHPESTGSGYYIQNVIKEAALQGHDNYLLSGSSGKKHIPDSLPVSAHAEVEFGRPPLDFAIAGMSDVMPYPSSQFKKLSGTKLTRYIEAWTDGIHRAVAMSYPELIHSHHLWIMTSLAKQLYPEIPMVASCHSTDLRQFELCPQHRELVLKGCLGAERVLSLSRQQQDQIVQVYGIDRQKTTLVGGGFDAERFSASRSAGPPTPPPVEILYGGKLSYAKGVKWLLESIREIPKANYRLHLAGSGSGPEAEECERLARELSPTVHLHGRLDQEQFASLLARCHVFILPSFYEGLPLVVLEALASGCRVVTTDLPGCKELLGKASDDLVRWVRLPELATIDTPKKEDEELLKKRLKSAIKAVVLQTQAAPHPLTAEVDELLAERSWPRVFAKIEKAYQEATNPG